MARLASVNVGAAREVEIEGRPTRTAIVKTPVDGRRRVEGVHVVGDVQGDPSVHGGPTKALYAYALEDYAWWGEQLGSPLAPGTFGDNLTVEGLEVTGALVGERWEVGSAVLGVTEPRIPCFKLGWRMGDRRFPSRFRDAARPGAYLTILEPGDVGAGDAIRVVDRPEHGVTVGMVERAYHGERHLTSRLLDAPQLSPGWRRWAEEVAARR